jgi:hypothetical protein
MIRNRSPAPWPMVESSRRRRRLGRRSLVVALLYTACRTGTEVPAPIVVSSNLTTTLPLVRVLAVTLAQPAELEVDYWADDGPRLRARSAWASAHAVALTRLRTGRSYHYQIVRTAIQGSFSTDTLPSDLALARGAATGVRSVPLVMLHLFQPGGFMGYAIMDDANEVVWYWRTTDFPFGMARRDNGNFVLMDKVRGLVEVSPDGRVVHELAQDLANREMHHDVIAGANNTVLFIAYDDRVVGGRQIRGEAIWEWTPETGATVQRWSVWDHVALADAPAPRASGEWMHANALAIGPRRNIVVSSYFWNQILSITPDWQRVEWRLGGANATSPVAGADQFSGQHAAREISPGHVVMFDNGVDRGGYSRAVEYVMDSGGAHAVWQWHSDPANFATAVGSARRLSNGNTLVAFGMSPGLAGSTGPTEVYEVGGDGAVRWHLVMNTQVMFRAEPLESVGTEAVVR